jgi:hypothetical protein
LIPRVFGTYHVLVGSASCSGYGRAGLTEKPPLRVRTI